MAPHSSRHHSSCYGKRVGVAKKLIMNSLNQNRLGKTLVDYRIQSRFRNLTYIRIQIEQVKNQSTAKEQSHCAPTTSAIPRTGQFSSVQFSSVAQSCPTLCDPMNCSTPGLPVHHQLLEFTQTHVHPVHDAIQPSHPRLSPSPPAPNPSQHQSLFQ